MEYQTSSNINDSIILKEVMDTHCPVSKDFKASYILHFVKKILFLIMMGGKAICEDEDEFDDDELDNSTMPNEMEIKDREHSYQIKRLSFEIALRCSENADDPHSTVMHFMKMLCAYPWEGKLLMMLAAFSINFGEFHLRAFKGSKTPLLAMAPSHIQQSISLFIKSVLRLTDIIVELAQSSSYNSSPVIPLASYWIFTSILTCASYFNCLPSIIGSEWLTNEVSKLSSLTATVKDIFSYCRPMLEMKREEDSYNALWCAFSDENPAPSTNLDVLKLIFNVKDVDKEKPLFDWEGRMIGVRSLENKKSVLVITSHLDIDYSMVFASSFMSEVRIAHLWIPIVDDPTLWNTAAMENDYRKLARMLNFLTVKNVQKSIASGFARFVKKKFFPTFQIGGGPIIVLLDHQGRMVDCITTHMIVKRFIDFTSKVRGVGEFKKRDSKVPLFKNMVKEMTLSVRHLVSDIDEKISDFAKEMNSKLEEWCHGIESDINNSTEDIWFKLAMEEDPWKEKTWCTKLLIGNDLFIEQAKEGVNANEHIFFIGGKDITWVKTFASKILTKIHFNPQLTIKMAYVGSNNKVALAIRQDRICETFEHGIEEQSCFWMNLQSIFFSRIKFLDETYGDEESDEIVKGLKCLLSYETEGVAVDGWALLCKGNKIVLYDLGDKMLAVMNEYEKWKESAIIKGFDQAFKAHHYEMFGSTCTPQHHHCALEYPSNSNKVPENIKCPQCCHNMQKFVTFKCYHEYLCKDGKELFDMHED